MSDSHPFKSYISSRWIFFLVSMILLLILPYLIPLPEAKYSTSRELADPQGKFFDYQGYEGFYVDLSPEKEETVVFIHGFGSSTYSWKEIMKMMEDSEYRLVAIDLKGFGMTEKKSEEDFSHIAQVQYIKGILANLDIQRANFVGHSMGGNVISILAMDDPELIELLTYIDPTIIYKKARFTWVVELPVIDRYMQHILLRVMDKDRIEQMLNSAYFSAVPTEGVIDNYYKPIQIESWELALIGITRDSGQNEVDLPKIDRDTPTLILWGMEDEWVPLASSEPLIDYFNDETFIQYENIGHVPHEEDVERVYGDLTEFLSE